MGVMRFFGVSAIIPTTVFLTVSFFVLFTARKTETKCLKIFGYVIAVLLWISAALVLSGGIYSILTSKHPMMQQKMQGKMPGQMMQR